MRILTLTLFIIAATISSKTASAAKSFYLPNNQDIAKVEALYKDKNYIEAFPLYQKLAKSGDTYSQYKLSIMYLLGQGTAKDMMQAYSWAYVAKASKKQEFIDYHDKLEASLEPDLKQAYEDAAFDLYLQYNELTISKRFLKYLKKEFPKCTGSRLRSISACQRIQVMCEGNIGSTNYLNAKDACLEFVAKIQPDNLKAMDKAIRVIEKKIDEIEQREGKVIISEDN